MIRYRLATQQDNEQLIALTAAAGMQADISLRIDRSPDFFALLRLRGETNIFVAEEDNAIIGAICVSLQLIYVGQQVCPLHYIGDFKVAAPFRNKGVGMQLCNEMASYIIAQGADLAFLNIAKGNTKPLSFFSNRPQVPDFENIGVFIIHQFVGKKRKAAHASFTIEPAAISDELLQFLNHHYSAYQLGTVVTAQKLEDTQLFVIRQNNTIIAAMCIADTMGIKQNVVTGLSLKLKWLLTAINAMYNWSGISKMPTLNEPVRLLYIKYLAVNNWNRAMVRLLINHARQMAYARQYSFASIGLHEKDPLNKCFSGMLKFSFHSVGMLVSIKDNKQLVEKVKQGIPFEDYSLV